MIDEDIFERYRNTIGKKGSYDKGVLSQKKHNKKYFSKNKEDLKKYMKEYYNRRMEDGQANQQDQERSKQG